MYRIIGCIAEQHDLRLVALAACICVLACSTTVNLLARARSVPDREALAWLAVAATLFGSGIWSLHFVAMLAFTPGAGFGYRISATILSSVVAIVGTMPAFIVWRFSRNRALGVGVGGGLMGLAVSGMHYIGVASVQFAGWFSYNSQTVLTSVAIGVTFAILGLARFDAKTSCWRRFEIAAWFALSICGLHFTAMTALTLEVGTSTNLAGAVLASGSLAIAVGSVALAILTVSMAATVMEQHLCQRAVLELHRMRALGDVAQEALIVCRDGGILQVNAACGRMFGVSTRQLVGQRVRELFVDSDQPKVMRPADDRSTGSVLEEVRAKTADGNVLPVELCRGEIIYEGRPATVMALRDLSDRKRDEEKIRHLAHHDALTDLPNRFLLQERFNHDLAVASRLGKPMALLYLDLDRFKPVNDLFGHTGGDALLVQVADRLRQELRDTDTVARIGGDEFVVLASIEQPGDASMIAAKLIECVSRPFDLLGASVEIGTSIGIALYPEDGDNQDALMHSADTALYRAKNEKRGTFRFFEIAMDEHLRAQRRLEQDLRQAVEHDQMSLHYQPLVACATGEVEGFEALLRWNHPVRGTVPPSEFIPLAEENGSIVELGHWVLETACRAAAGWSEPRRVAVNVSPVQLRQPDFPRRVETILTCTGLPGSRLEIEITEGVLMEGTTHARDTLNALRGLGVRIALDDFGTGYSSLSYLHSFRFDKLKIDRSFVSRLEDDGDATMIVRTIIGLAHNLGLEIVAEGVETPAQLAMIRDNLCDQAQGYLLGRPMPMDEPTELMIMRARSLVGGLRNVLVPTLIEARVT